MTLAHTVPWQPPITRWGRAWRLVVMLAVSAAVSVQPFAHLLWHHHVWWVVVDLLLGALSFWLVRYRRRWPVPVALTLAAMGVASMSGSGPAALAFASVATRRRWSEVLVVGIAVVAGGELWQLLVPGGTSDPVWVGLLVGGVLVLAVGGWGMYIGSRRELLWQLRDRAERAEAEQALRDSQARTNERARIAREMHDVLAHRISQISMHAGALAFRQDLPADDLRRGAADIRTRANEALTDLRGVLGVLRDPETGGPLDRPQPNLADVPRLVDECREAGLRVEFEGEVAGTVPDPLGRTVYRIVQEGITNAGKHAPGATVTVRVAGGPERGIDVTVTNPVGFGASGTPGAGLGLVGLSERTELSGGRLETGRHDGVFRLHGWLPWTE
ncbi:MAG: histidine kinase [Thermoleophilia bacterium]